MLVCGGLYLFSWLNAPHRQNVSTHVVGHTFHKKNSDFIVLLFCMQFSNATKKKMKKKMFNKIMWWDASVASASHINSCQTVKYNTDVPEHINNFKYI